ncbi:MAG: formimidoylglutamate deiminase [Actinocatenispora sp.]
MTRYWCPLLWTGRPGPGGLHRDVLLTVEKQRFEAVEPGVGTPPPDAVRLSGFSMPGLANAHSHAFHRALRGRTHSGRGSFWTWREQMYEVADRLDPDSYRDLARATYAEMALAGVTTVGEFHYLHHAPGGARYADPNVMSAALVQAAADAGVRITLLDACYLNGGLDSDGRSVPLTGPQLRFGDGTADAWATRVDAFRPAGEHARVGAAIHSVRAVPPDQMRTVARSSAGSQALHVHVSEQRAENDACHAAYGHTPVHMLDAAGALHPTTTLVHATHLSAADLALVQHAGARTCLCPTTERDLADGIGPAVSLHERQPHSLCLGSDSHAVIDLFEEARAVELDERLRTQSRGHFTADTLLVAAVSGHDALAWDGAGRIEPGTRADLVTLDTDSVRLAGCADWSGTDRGIDHTALAAIAFAAGAPDVRHVLVDGRPVVRDGRHLLVDDVPAALTRSVRKVLR